MLGDYGRSPVLAPLRRGERISLPFSEPFGLALLGNREDDARSTLTPGIRAFDRGKASRMSQKLDFAAGDLVVYPAHGVGKVDGVETLTVAGQSVSLYAITFEKERMKLKIPVAKAKTSGLRRLSSKDRLKAALETLQGRARVRRTMWSRRAQEYEAKINSGDPVSIA
jgi:transcription-repair coupling factor (superfamily II helicase)